MPSATAVASMLASRPRCRRRWRSIAERPYPSPALRERGSGAELAILEDRFALFDEGGHALDRILRLEGEGREIGLDLEPLRQGQIEGTADRIARQAQDRQAVAGHLARKGDAGLDELAVDQPVDETDARRLLGVERPAG